MVLKDRPNAQIVLLARFPLVNMQQVHFGVIIVVQAHFRLLDSQSVPHVMQANTRAYVQHPAHFVKLVNILQVRQICV
jgi:hypothetical protein